MDDTRNLGRGAGTTFIARHSRKHLEAGRCERRAYRFVADFVSSHPTCPDCGYRFSKVDAVRGVVREDKPCMPRCMGATTGGTCECKCGGTNHGGAWSA